MYCQRCRKNVSVDSGRCAECRTQLGARFCTNGHAMDPAWSECRYCVTASDGGAGVSGPAGLSGKGTGEGFVKGATLLEGPGDSIAGEYFRDKGRTSNQFGSTKAETVVERDSSKGKTLFDPGSGPHRRAARARLVGWLVTFSLDPSGDDFQLREGRNTIGSADDCDVVIQHSSVSAHHAVLMYRDGRFMIRDNDAQNGTYLNGTDVFGREANEVNAGDTLRIGAVELLFQTVFAERAAVASATIAPSS